MEMLIVNKKLADKMFDMGVELIENARLVDGNKCFVFNVLPGQQALIKRLIAGAI